MYDSASKKRILILGGGFGGVATARHLEGLCRRRPDVEIVLVSRDNFLLMTPLLFEVFSGALDVRSCSFPIRTFLCTTRFVEAAVQGIDLDRHVVRLGAAGESKEFAYDQLVLALGSKTDRERTPGSEHAFTFKTLADALLLRNHVIERFERADVETDPQRKAQLLTFVVIGGGLVGVELLGELTAFVDGITPLYEHVKRDEIRFLLVQGAGCIMPEIDLELACYGARVLARRRGVELRINTRVRATITPCDLHLPRMLRNLGRPLALFLCLDIVVVVAYVFFDQRWLALPNLPLAIGGGALGVILGFRNNISYARWWEARTLWGRIVNHSRCLGRQVVAYSSVDDRSQDRGLIQDTQRRIVYYQIAYANSLRCQLRGQDLWPELAPFLSKAEIDSLRGEKNAAAEIQRRMALLIQDCYLHGWLGAIPLGLLDNGLTELANAQGGCERIKNTPMPKHYDYLISFFIHVYCFLMPFGMVANLGLLTPIGSSLLGFGFLALESIGRDLEHPFDNSAHDVAMTSICRTIETNLKQYLRESDLPAPVEPVRGILW